MPIEKASNRTDNLLRFVIMTLLIELHLRGIMIGREARTDHDDVVIVRANNLAQTFVEIEPISNDISTDIIGRNTASYLIEINTHTFCRNDIPVEGRI